MTLYRRMVLASLVLAAGNPIRADTASSTVKVEFLDGQTKITPFEPTINLAVSPSVILELLPGGARFNVAPVLAVRTLAREAEKQQLELKGLKNPTLDALLAKLARDPNQANLSDVLRALGDAARKDSKEIKAEDKKKVEAAREALDKAGESITLSSNRFLLNFHRGWYWEYLRGDRRDIWSAHQVCEANSENDKRCHHVDFTTTLPGAGWDIYLTNRTYAFDFPVVIECQSGCPGSSPSRLLVIHIDTASWAISSSAGLMFPFLRDERYSINENNELTRLSDSDIPYSAATYLHYCPVNGIPILTAFCPTLAVGSKIPSDGVLVGLGLGARLKPLESFNAAYFDLGVAYGPHKTLNDTNLAKPRPIVVSPGTDPKDVLATHHAFKFFVGVSIGITSGIEKFRGVFPGAGGESSQVQSAPPDATRSQTPTLTATPTLTTTPTPTPTPTAH